MNFIKMHGCGNDYVLVDGFEAKLKDPSSAAGFLCDRHTGIGADGLILVEPSPTSDARMRIFNADGSEAEMCGNGIRCAAKLLIGQGKGSAGRVQIETMAGERTVTSCEPFRGEDQLEVDMGRPDFLDPDQAERKIELSGRTVSGTAVSMGNPHFVVFVDRLDDFPVLDCGPRIGKDAVFSNGTNVEFVEVLGDGTLKQRTWERGVGETLACGTGAAAVAAAAITRGVATSPVLIQLEGGALTVRWDGEGSIYLSGNAVEVFRGEIEWVEE